MSKRVLIIDDEQHIRQMIRITLEAAGFEVDEAPDGLQGLERYGDGSQWDGVILDQRMAGIDGLETLRRMKEQDPSARVVMATAYASIELAVDAMKMGATDFVRKPLTPETLRNAIAAAIAKPRIAHEQVVIEKAEAAPIETITMNGFAIQDDKTVSSNERHFVVMNPSGSQHDVVVRIDNEVLGYVERITRRHLPLESSFWTAQARRLLSDYLWEKGEVPATKFMTLREIERSDLLVAERWTDA